MKGQKKRLFVLILSFIPITLLACLSLIGVLWLTPYVNMTYTIFYLNLMQNFRKALTGLYRKGAAMLYASAAPSTVLAPELIHFKYQIIKLSRAPSSTASALPLSTPVRWSFTSV